MRTHTTPSASPSISRATKEAHPKGEYMPLLRQLLGGLRKTKKGDFSIRLPLDHDGIGGEIAQAFNDILELNEKMSDELERITKVVGHEGRISQRATLGDVSGCWKDNVENINGLIGDLVQPTTDVARVISA